MSRSQGSTRTRSAWGRGSIRKRGSSHYEVRVTAGKDPVSGERITLQATGHTMREAEKLRTKLLAEADGLRASRTNATLGSLLDRWLPQHDVDEHTRASYESLIRNHIRPALGDVPMTVLVRRATETLELFYAGLRRCRVRCDGQRLVDHALDGDHDCVAAGCRPHACRPLAPATVCRIHAVLSAACRAAVRWGWIPFNPTDAARQPTRPRPNPNPPSPADAARIVEAAWQQDSEWGLYLWLAIVTGARRGELCALRFGDVDLDAGVLRIASNYVGGRLKDTKTHQMRRVSIDEATSELIRQYRKECDDALAPLGVAIRASDFVFSAAPDHSRPRHPSSLTHRFKRLVDRLGIDTHLHALRHYAATELLTAGVDLRTVAGRLGHGDGTTTLRHYAAWVNAADQTAASILSARLTAPNG